MSGHDNLNPAQLSMFMRSGDLAKMPSGDQSPRETLARMQEIKLAESKTYGYETSIGTHNHKAPAPGNNTLYDAIASEGVQQPVRMYHDNFDEDPDQPRVRITDGNHRVASSAHIGPEMLVPVIHDGSSQLRGQRR